MSPHKTPGIILMMNFKKSMQTTALIEIDEPNGESVCTKKFRIKEPKNVGTNTLQEIEVTFNTKMQEDFLVLTLESVEDSHFLQALIKKQVSKAHKLCDAAIVYKSDNGLILMLIEMKSKRYKPEDVYIQLRNGMLLITYLIGVLGNEFPKHSIKTIYYVFDNNTNTKPPSKGNADFAKKEGN